MLAALVRYSEPEHPCSALGIDSPVSEGLDGYLCRLSNRLETRCSIFLIQAEAKIRIKSWTVVMTGA